MSKYAFNGSSKKSTISLIMTSGNSQISNSNKIQCFIIDMIRSMYLGNENYFVVCEALITLIRKDLTILA